MPRRVIDMVGGVFGRMTVLSRSNESGPSAMWLCVCACGQRKSVAGHLLRRGQVKSCGCQRRESSANNLRKLYERGVRGALRHGNARCGFETAEWRAWTAMHARCKRQPGYAGRIKVCERWSDFLAFLEDVGLRPSPAHSLDRVNPFGNYELGNCRWATDKEQARNRTNSRFVEFNGERRTLAEWAEMSGVKYCTLRQRLDRGWSAERAIGNCK